MATAIAELSPDLQRFDGESPEHFVVDMFHVAADPSAALATAADTDKRQVGGGHSGNCS